MPSDELTPDEYLSPHGDPHTVSEIVGKTITSAVRQEFSVSERLVITFTDSTELIVESFTGYEDSSLRLRLDAPGS